MHYLLVLVYFYTCLLLELASRYELGYLLFVIFPLHQIRVRRHESTQPAEDFVLYIGRGGTVLAERLFAARRHA